MTNVNDLLRDHVTLTVECLSPLKEPDWRVMSRARLFVAGCDSEPSQQQLACPPQRCHPESRARQGVSQRKMGWTGTKSPTRSARNACGACQDRHRGQFWLPVCLDDAAQRLCGASRWARSSSASDGGRLDLA